MDTPTHPTIGSAAPGRELVLRTIAAHAPSLLGTARRYSVCADDGDDAYQRALEIFLRRADSVDPEHAVGWLRTVVKHEALAVRAGRLRLVGAGEVDLDREEAVHLAGAEERAADREHAERGAEALQRLKPQEVRALVLKARGYSYREICEITGWTYTKVNRCLTEGRRAFLERYDEIASGRECDRWSSVLSALADGEATAEQIAAVRPHLRACTACRAVLRGFRTTPGSVAAIAPLAALASGDNGAGVVGRGWEALTGALPDPAVHAATAVHGRVVVAAQKLHAGIEALSTGKLTAVAASATVLGGGGIAAVEPGVPSSPAPVAKVAAHPRLAHATTRTVPPLRRSPGPTADRLDSSTGSTPTPEVRAPAEEFGPGGEAAGEVAPVMASGSGPGVADGAAEPASTDAPPPARTSRRHTGPGAAPPPGDAPSRRGAAPSTAEFSP
jgi:RNA polymerase sigma factor (sigma-70 family)